MADAPKLLGTDTLRQAYPKFNQAIDNSNEALTTANVAKSTADTAKSRADTALTKSDNTQTQLNTIVINGDSSVEAAQARVDEHGKPYTTLQDRLNSRDKQSIYNTVSKMAKGEAVKIVACGDSITFGQDGSNAGVQVAQSERYPYELQRILQSVYNNPLISVVNKGQPGWSSDSWARVEGRDFKSLVLAENPNLVIIMLGINDVHADLTREAYRSNLDYLIKLCQDSNVDVILMSPTPTLQKTESSVATVKQINMQIMEYSQIAKNLANNKNVFFVDIQQEFLDLFYKQNVYKPTDIINADFTHLNSYRLIANIIIKNLMASSTLQITGEQKIQAVGSPYIYTNLTKNDVVTYLGISDYERNYYMLSNGGKYLKFRFNVLKKGLNLKLKYNLSKVNGQIGIYDNGVKVMDLLQHNGDNATGSMVMHSVATTIIENLAMGFHEVVIDVANSSMVGTVSNPYQIIVEAFEFEENKEREVVRKKTIASVPNSTYTEAFADIEVKASKNLLIDYEGTLKEGLQFFIFAARRDATTYVQPLVLSISSGRLSLLDRTIWTGEQTVTAGNTTIDLSKKHNIKIVVYNSRRVTVYLNSIQEIDVTASRTNVKVGKFVINYNNTVGNALIDIDSLVIKHI